MLNIIIPTTHLQYNSLQWQNCKIGKNYNGKIGKIVEEFWFFIPWENENKIDEK